MGPSSVVASLLIKLGLDPSGVTSGVQQAQGALGSLTKHADAARALAGAAVGGFVVKGMEDFARFDDRMREVFTLMPGVTQDVMDQMSTQVREMAVEFGGNAEDMAGALYQSISAGMDPTKAIGFMETATKAAVAGVSDSKTAATLLASTLNSYSMGAEHAMEVSDIFFTTVKQGITTFPELAGVMADISPTAAVLGIELKETTAALAAMTKQGFNTAAASTNIAAVLTLLQKGTPELTKVLTEMGYESGQAALDALGLQGTLEMMREGADRLGIAIPKMTGRVQAAKAIFALTGDKAEDAREVLDGFEDTAGSVEGAFEMMEGGVGASIRKVQATIQELAYKAGEALQPVAPLFLAFGPQIGRLLGAGIGAGLGWAMKGLGAIVEHGVIGAAQAAQGAASSAFGKLGTLAGGRFGMLFKVAALAAVALVWIEVWNQFQALLDKIEARKNQILADTEKAISTGTDATIAELGKAARIMNQTQGWDRIIQDTVIGGEKVEQLLTLGKAISETTDLTADQIARSVRALDEAAVEAFARGNERIGRELSRMAEDMEARFFELDQAARSSEKVAGTLRDGATMLEMGYLTVIQTIEDAVGPITAAGDKVGDAVDSIAETFRERVSSGAAAVSSAWDTLTNALNKGPKIMSLDKRMETARKAITRNVARLRKAVKARDTVAAGAYAERVVQARAAVRTMRGDEGQAVLRRAQTVLANSRRIAARQHKGMADDAKRESARGAKAVKSNAEKAGKAMPEELTASAPKASAAARRITTSVKTPMEAAATEATTWGQHLGQNYAAGILSQVSAVEASSAALAAAASGNIKMSAPPRKGPLSTIRTWGPHLIENWIGPMRGRIRDVERIGDALGRAVTPRHGPMALTPGIDRLRLAPARVDALSSSRRGGGDVHFHIGTLVANDRGLDELDRRIGRRRRMRDRDVFLYNDTN